MGLARALNDHVVQRLAAHPARQLLAGEFRSPFCTGRRVAGHVRSDRQDAFRGFAGQEFDDLVTAGLGMSLVRPDRRDEAFRNRSIGSIRQWIESVTDTLKGHLDLERHGAPPGPSTSALPGICWPWPPPSGTTGPPAHPSSDR